MIQLAQHFRRRQIIGWALLIASFSVGLLTLYKGEFGDEADNLVVGSLILQGYTLYYDIFSHHFPFPYYWVAIIIGLFGRSILTVRLSVLVFQTAVFALSMELNRSYWLVGITAVLWSILRSFYKGNMVLYSAFSGTALMLIFVMVLAVLQQRSSPDWKHWLILGLFSAIAIMSDPLSIYAITVAVIFLFTKKPVWSMRVSFVIGSVLLLYMGYLSAIGNAQNFWSNAILFNSQIYAKYSYTNPLRFGELFDMAIKGLEITDKIWLNIDPLKPILDGYTELDSWLFTGFIYRFSIIAASLFLLLEKKFRTSAFLYLYAASTLIINKWDFRGQPFVLVSLVAISALITCEWWSDPNGRFLKTAQTIVGLFVLGITMWLCLRLTVNIYINFNTFGEAQFTNFEKDSANIQELACHQSGVVLAHYPTGTYYYWFSEMKPVSKYVFMWPWVADVGLNDVIHELKREHTLAIVVRSDGVVWGKFNTKEYLLPLDEFLKMNYHKVAEGIYQSPALYSRCSSQ